MIQGTFMQFAISHHENRCEFPAAAPKALSRTVKTAVITAVAFTAVVTAVARDSADDPCCEAPYLSAPIELCVLPPMDLKPRKSSFQPNLRLVNPNFLEEVMPVLVPKGQISQLLNPRILSGFVSQVVGTGNITFLDMCESLGKQLDI
jgi:hypothetical protein